MAFEKAQKLIEEVLEVLVSERRTKAQAFREFISSVVSGARRLTLPPRRGELGTVNVEVRPWRSSAVAMPP